MVAAGGDFAADAAFSGRRLGDHVINIPLLFLRLHLLKLLADLVFISQLANSFSCCTV